jgi:hypothetical protein
VRWKKKSLPQVKSANGKKVDLISGREANEREKENESEGSVRL